MLVQKETKLIREITIEDVEYENDDQAIGAIRADLIDLFDSTYFLMFEQSTDRICHFKINLELFNPDSANAMARCVELAFRSFRERFHEVGKATFTQRIDLKGLLHVCVDLSCVKA